MNENYQNNEYDGFYEEDEEPIDWAKYISAAIKYWKKIVIVTFCFAVLSVIVALCQKRQYEVSVTLAPEAQAGSSKGGSLGGLASMVGLNLGSVSSADALNISLFPEIAQSTPFLTQLFEVELEKMPKLPKDKVEAKKILANRPFETEKLFDVITRRNEEKGFMAKMVESIFGLEDDLDEDYLIVQRDMLTKEQDEVLNKLRKMISVEVDKKTSVTTINVKMEDPLMCAQLADTVCRRLREYVFAYRTEKERNNFDYYQALCDSTYVLMVEAQTAYADFVDNNFNMVRQSATLRGQRLEQEANIASQVYQQMVQQRELSRSQLQDVKPVFAVVEPATMPLRPSNSKRKTCMTITFLGFVLACAWYVVGKDWLAENMPSFKSMLIEKDNNNAQM